MDQMHLYRAVNPRYRDGWSYLNDDAYVATAKLTPPKMVRPGNGYDDGGTYLRWATLPRDVPTVHGAQALRDTLGGSGCRHEYDCCGCQRVSVHARRVTRRRWLVRLNVSYNY